MSTKLIKILDLIKDKLATFDYADGDRLFLNFRLDDSVKEKIQFHGSMHSLLIFREGCWFFSDA